MEDESGQVKAYERLTALKRNEAAAENTSVQFQVLEKELDVLKQAMENRNMEDVLNVLTDMQYFIFNNVQQLGLQERFANLFEEVSISAYPGLDEETKDVA